jgi:sulfur-carrier protein
LKDYTHGTKECELKDSKDVLSLVGELNQMFPGIEDRILDEQDRMREYVNVFVNGENSRDLQSEGTRLKNGDIVHILPSVAGG